MGTVDANSSIRLAAFESMALVPHSQHTTDAKRPATGPSVWQTTTKTSQCVNGVSEGEMAEETTAEVVATVERVTAVGATARYGGDCRV